jgi:motility quorum-sensing regulator/GCU-specific mRNA interferase toxin
MEKNVPHYPLAEIQAQMTTVREMNLTISARTGIRAVGMAQADALAVVQKLIRKNFYKSMTTHANHRIWQDVYHGQYNGAALYITQQLVRQHMYQWSKSLLKPKRRCRSPIYRAISRLAIAR